MSYSPTFTGSVLAANFTMLAEIGAQSDILTTIAGPAVGAAIAWVLLRYTMDRGKADAVRIREQDRTILEIAQRQVEIQTKTVATLDSLGSKLDRTNEASSDTNVIIRQFLQELRNRPCLTDQSKRESYHE